MAVGLVGQILTQLRQNLSHGLPRGWRLSLRCRLAAPQLEWGAPDNLQHQAGKSVSVLRQPFGYLLRGAAIIIFQAPPQSVGQNFLRKTAHKVVLFLLQQNRLEILWTAEFLPGYQLARRVDGKGPILLTPGADPIVIFQPKTDRVHPGVTGRAKGIGPMLLHSLAKRSGQDLSVFQFRHVRRRRRRRGAQDIV